MEDGFRTVTSIKPENRSLRERSSAFGRTVNFSILGYDEAGDWHAPVVAGAVKTETAELVNDAVCSVESELKHYSCAEHATGRRSHQRVPVADQSLRLTVFEVEIV